MDPKEAVLCRHCAGFFPIRAVEPHLAPICRPHKPNAAAFLKSAADDDDCPICNILRDHASFANLGIDDSDRLGMISTTLSLAEIQVFDSGVSWAVLRVVSENAHDGRCYTDEFSITTCQVSSPTATREIWRLSETTIPDKISTVASWFHDCVSKHDECRQLTVGQLPKRLIFAGSESSGSSSPPRLVTTAEVQTRESPQSELVYATLSHCWGPTLHVRTLRDNKDSFGRELPVDSFPQTYLDALMIVRALNVPYLWIDSLCIVQDDPSEWEEEAAKMKDIYSGSVLIIAASDSAEGFEGCFWRRHGPRDVSDCQPGGDLARGSSSQRGRSPRFFTARGSSACSGVMPDSELVRIQVGHVRDAHQLTVLNTRGWTLQEHILPRRVVYCMRSEVHWQCMSCYRTEPGVTFDNLGLGVGQGDPDSARQHFRRLKGGAPAPDSRRLDEVWWSWMTNYSKREFTFWTDRLPALAGVAQHYEEATGDTVVLGLRQGSLLQDLLWIRIGRARVSHQGNLTNPEIENLPSWSWLSCPAEVLFDFWQLATPGSAGTEGRGEVVRDHTSVVDLAVQWSGQRFTSSVQDTRLTLQGPTRDVILQEVVPEEPAAERRNPPLLRFDDDENADPARSSLSRSCDGQFDSESEANRPLAASRYKCLLLRSRWEMLLENSEEAMANETFLILQPCAAGAGTKTGSSKLYKRVGIGCFTGKVPIFDFGIREQVCMS